MVIKDGGDTCAGAYALDYSPINQSSFLTLAKMIIGMDVPAEIRVRWIDGECTAQHEFVMFFIVCLYLISNSQRFDHK